MIVIMIVVIMILLLSLLLLSLSKHIPRHGERPALRVRLPAAGRQSVPSSGVASWEQSRWGQWNNTVLHVCLSKHVKRQPRCKHTIVYCPHLRYPHIEISGICAPCRRAHLPMPCPCLCRARANQVAAVLLWFRGKRIV